MDNLCSSKKLALAQLKTGIVGINSLLQDKYSEMKLSNVSSEIRDFVDNCLDKQKFSENLSTAESSLEDIKEHLGAKS